MFSIWKSVKWKCEKWIVFHLGNWAGEPSGVGRRAVRTVRGRRAFRFVVDAWAEPLVHSLTFRKSTAFVWLLGCGVFFAAILCIIISLFISRLCAMHIWIVARHVIFAWRAIVLLSLESN